MDSAQDLKSNMKPVVLNTRPAPQGEILQQLLISAGFESHQYCPYFISPTADLEEDRSAINTALSLDSYSDIIITSHFAADFGLDFLSNFWPQWPVQRWWAIGTATAKTMSKFNIDASTTPEDQPDNSESLLSNLNLLWQQEETHNDDLRLPKVLIITGQNGRGLLQKELQYRSIPVDTLEVYSRKENPEAFKAFHCDAVILTSQEAAAKIIQNRENLLKFGSHCHFICASERIATFVRQLGTEQVLNSGSAKNEVLIQTLQQLLLR